MVAKIADDDSDVEVDHYEPDISKVQDFSEDSDSEPGKTGAETKPAEDANLDAFLSGDPSQKEYESFWGLNIVFNETMKCILNELLFIYLQILTRFSL